VGVENGPARRGKDKRLDVVDEQPAELEVGCEAGSDRHGADAVLRLRWGEAAAVEATPDLYSPAVEGGVAPAERERLSDPQAGLSKHLEEEPPPIRNLGEQPLELLLAERLDLLALFGERLPAERQADAGRWVSANIAGLEGVGEHRLDGRQGE